MRFRIRLHWSFPALLALAVLLPLALLGWIAWNERGRTLEEAERTAVRTVAALHEHVAKVLETNELVLDEASRMVEGRSWDEIENDRRLWEDLSRIARNLGQVRTVTLVDAQGRVRMTSLRFPVPAVTVEDRDYFRAQRERDAGTFVSAAYTGRIADDRLIAFSRRRSTPDGAFDGVVQVATPVSYFTAFWEQFAPTIAHVVPLVRADGQVIARHPTLNNPERLNLAGPFMSRALARPEGTYRAVSQVDGVERLNAYARVKDYPLFVSFGVETRAVLARWREGLVVHAVFAALAATALLAAAGMALRQSRAHEVASRRWRETADRLASEMARRETAEEALRQAQKLEAVGQLTGGVAHDFNNLLTIIKSSTDLLRRPGLPEERRRRYVDAISDTVDRAARLTGQLLAFARRQALKPEVFDAGRNVAAIGEMVGTLVGARIRVETRMPDGPCYVSADPSQFDTALVNMAVNARDAMDGEGRLTVSVRATDEIPATRSHPARRGAFVAVEVADTGSGIASDRIDRIFEPFYTTKGVGQGTGLGLSQVFGFAKQSGGDITVESEVGRGTAFTLYLPRVEAAPAGDIPAPPGPGRAAPGGGRRVLVVEDNKDVGAFSTQLLQDLGYETTWAADADDALKQLEQASGFDAVFSDVVMPGMNGVELGHEIRRRFPGLPVVLTSGYSHVLAEEGRHGFELLRKPYAVEELSRVLRRATRQRLGARAPADPAAV